jgi:hypothetical protein
MPGRGAQPIRTRRKQHDQFIDHCSGINGAPTTPEGRTHILAIIQELRQNVPSSQFDYRFCLYELEELQSIVFAFGGLSG